MEEVGLEFIDIGDFEDNPGILLNSLSNPCLPVISNALINHGFECHTPQLPEIDWEVGSQMLNSAF